MPAVGLLVLDKLLLEYSYTVITICVCNVIEGFVCLCNDPRGAMPLSPSLISVRYVEVLVFSYDCGSPCAFHLMVPMDILYDIYEYKTIYAKQLLFFFIPSKRKIFILRALYTLTNIFHPTN